MLRMPFLSILYTVYTRYLVYVFLRFLNKPAGKAARAAVSMDRDGTAADDDND